MMNLEEELFQKYSIDKNKLLKYGFIAKGDILLYEKFICQNEFKVVLEFDGKIKGKIFDVSADEEYTNFRIESSSGYSSKIRELFIELLVDIRDKCTENKLFFTKQARMINNYIVDKYKDSPEFLWKNFPTYAIYRNKKNRKWYALIGTVALNKVNKALSSSKLVEIINVKVDKNKIDDLLLINGVYEAYHMNKKNWVTIIFDETLSDDQIQKFVDESYNNI